MNKNKKTSRTGNRYSDPLPTRLRELLQTEKNQTELAKFLGASPQSVSNYANGIDKIDTKKLVKIAEYFNVSTDYLLGKTDIKTPDFSIRAFCEYTGLSQPALEVLVKMAERKDDFCIGLTDTLDKVLTSGGIELLRQIQIYFGIVAKPYSGTDEHGSGITPDVFENVALWNAQQKFTKVIQKIANKGEQ